MSGGLSKMENRLPVGPGSRGGRWSIDPECGCQEHVVVVCGFCRDRLHAEEES